jgi:hypothetical protein
VSLFESLAGHPIEVDTVDEAALRAQFAAARSEHERSMASVMLAYAKGNVIPMDDVAERFGIEPTSLRQWAERLLGAGA